MRTLPALPILALAACAPRALPEGMPATATATFRCDDGRVLASAFDNRANTARVLVAGRLIDLKGKRVASGIWYAGGGAELRGKGKDATWTEPGRPSVDCRAD